MNIADRRRSIASLRSVALGLAVILAAAFFTWSGTAFAERAMGSAQSLRDAYASMRDKIEHGALGQPIALESAQAGDTLTGDVWAVIEHPFDTVRNAFADGANWCDVLILDPNVKRCHAHSQGDGAPAVVDATLGRQHSEVRFSFRVTSRSEDYLGARLGAPSGPFGTTDYRIDFEAAPLDARRTLIHFGFSQRFGLRAQLAMKAYFTTLGRNKYGFTVVSRDGQGHPVYVRELRGGLERNAMRYFAAIDAYLDAPGAGQGDTRLRKWLEITQRYPQLHEDADYVAQKREEMADNAGRAFGGSALSVQR